MKYKEHKKMAQNTTKEKYTEQDIICIGARYNNPKRNYLLINPLQGKHIPVSPTICLNMFTHFGNQLKAKYPDTKLVIGFAETATAVGAGIASAFPDCKYICTTRENTFDHAHINFLEEHSHAIEQTLIMTNLEEYIDNTDTVIFVDDELSTGKTMRNVMEQLRIVYPALRKKRIVVASLVNRMSDENLKLAEDEGIVCESLLKIPNTDYTTVADQMIPFVKSADNVERDANNDDVHVTLITSPFSGQNPRVGTDIGAYHEMGINLGKFICQTKDMISNAKNVIIIGTEECMYPAIVIGSCLEEKGISVTTHSTTRSPIGVSNEIPQYPVTNGYKLTSFYEINRQTFLYNMKPVKNTPVIIVTDSDYIPNGAVDDMKNLLAQCGVTDILLIKIRT